MTHTEAVQVFRQGPAVMEDVLRGASQADTMFVPAPGKWNIRQIVRHLADTEIVVGMRLRHIVAEHEPALVPFDQDAWANNLGYYESADAFDSLALFSTLRNDTAKFLAALPAEAFQRNGVHPARGTKSLLEWVEIFGRHVFTHAGQIRNIRASLK